MAMVLHRRAIALTLSLVALAFSALALVEAFDWADVPGGRFFAIATPLVVCAPWLFLDVSSRWRTPRLPDERR